jgi:hypothetical protein
MTFQEVYEGLAPGQNALQKASFNIALLEPKKR